MIGQTELKDASNLANLVLEEMNNDNNNNNDSNDNAKSTPCKRVRYHDKYYRLKIPEPMSIATPPKRAKSNTVLRRIITPIGRQLQLGRKQLDEQKDRYNKLKLLEKHKATNSDLPLLIDKWTMVTKEALEQLSTQLSVPKQKILKSLGMERIPLCLQSDDEQTSSSDGNCNETDIRDED